MQTISQDYATVLEQFLASDEFAESVLSSTRAGFGGGSYSVELFSDGDWRVLWSQMIGNLYESPGLILVIPQLSDEDYQALEDMAGSEEYVHLIAYLQETDELEEIADLLRQRISEVYPYDR